MLKRHAGWDSMMINRDRGAQGGLRKHPTEIEQCFLPKRQKPVRFLRYKSQNGGNQLNRQNCSVGF